MDPKAFAAAKEKLEIAKSKLAAMKAARNLDQLAHLWIEFLTEQHRVYLRLRKATEKGPGKGWFDRILHDQRNDDLLKYVLHARDAAEHGIEAVTQKRGGGFAVRAKEGLKSIHIKHMAINPRPGVALEMDSETAAQVDVIFHSNSVHLVAVTDRGTVYQPPKEHLGDHINNLNPISVAELAIAYLERKCAEAETNFGS